MSLPEFVSLTGYHEYHIDEMRQRALSFYEQMRQRRTVRQFSNRPVPRDIIEQCIRAAATAPSGANLQPWHFVVVSDPSLKGQIRVAAEQEEQEFYQRRAPKGVARGSGSARYKRTQAISGNSSISHSHICGAIRKAA